MAEENFEAQWERKLIENENPGVAELYHLMVSRLRPADKAQLERNLANILRAMDDGALEVLDGTGREIGRLEKDLKDQRKMLRRIRAHVRLQHKNGIYQFSDVGYYGGEPFDNGTYRIEIRDEILEPRSLDEWLNYEEDGFRPMTLRDYMTINNRATIPHLRESMDAEDFDKFQAELRARGVMLGTQLNVVIGERRGHIAESYDYTFLHNVGRSSEIRDEDFTFPANEMRLSTPNGSKMSYCMGGVPELFIDEEGKEHIDYSELNLRFPNPIEYERPYPLAFVDNHVQAVEDDAILPAVAIRLTRLEDV